MNLMPQEIITVHLSTNKVKVIPVQAWRSPQGSKRWRIPEVLYYRHMQVAMLPALHTRCLYPPGDITWYSFLLEDGSTPGPQCGRNDKLMKNLNNSNRNDTHEHPDISI